MLRSIALCGVLGTLLCGSAFAGSIIWSQDFESSTAGSTSVSGFSSTWNGVATVGYHVVDSEGYSSIAGNNFLQVDPAYTESAVTLTLDGLSASATYTLSFTFFAIDSWDGSDRPWGPDYLSVTANGTTVFKDTFQNINADGSISGMPVYDSADPAISYIAGSFENAITANTVAMGCTACTYYDSAYTITISGLTATSSGQLTLVFAGLSDGLSTYGWQYDETVGLDNMVLTSNQAAASPEPGTWLSLLGGIAAVVFFRRRK
jgi:hypothetical protein